jgi:creatinine amidohydrolase
VSASSELGTLTRDAALERARAGAVCLLPVGALEQHGAHLPLATDALLAEAVCRRAAERAACDVLVAPPFWAGLSPHHLPLGATATLRIETFLAAVRELAESVRTWCPRVLVVNGHGGNRGPLVALGLDPGIPAVSYWELVPEVVAAVADADHGSPGHAGQMETSLMLAVRPDLVGRPASEFQRVDPSNTALLRVVMDASGVIGDPHTADAERGAILLDAAGAAVARVADSLANDPLEAAPR